MARGRLSELSERKVLGGNQHALPAGVFPDSLDYVALGHLHLAQQVGSRANLRYAGSPLPLSLAEGTYPHQVVRVDLNGDSPPEIRAIPVPLQVQILRLPEGDPQPLEQVLTSLQNLRVDAVADERWPFVEVTVLVDRPQPALRQMISDALADAPVRLLRIQPVYPGDSSPLADSVTEVDLDELQPGEVFRQCYRRQHDADPPPELATAFHELVEAVEAEET
jgi:exonuclease SbcD